MIIAVDGYEANVNQRVGIGRYAYEILRSIYENLKHEGSKIRYPELIIKIYLPDPPLPDMPQETEWWQYRVVKPKKFWTYIGLPYALLTDRPKPNVVFSPTHYIPRFVQYPKVISIMDLSYIKYPELFRRKDLYQLINWTKFSISHADSIFTISQASKHDIIAKYRIPGDMVTVTYPGIDLINTANMEKGNIVEKYHLSKNFILAVGTLQPRKNYLKLIESFSIFLHKNKQKFINLELVIIGKKGWMYDEILSAPKRFNLENQVKFLEYVDADDLPYFYRSAICFTLPSLYEGFGLPVAEAMSYGCPVVVSRVSSLPEVAGKAGIYVDPEDANSIASGLLAAVRERNLMQGKWRVKQGFEHLKQFSWEKAAIQTLAVLKKTARP
jgi:glycosyltransferase involved in cell wall biosynthesis